MNGRAHRKSGSVTVAPALTRMVLRFFDEAVDATGDDRQAAMLASATLMAAVDRLEASRKRPAPAAKTVE